MKGATSMTFAARTEGSTSEEACALRHHMWSICRRARASGDELTGLDVSHGHLAALPLDTIDAETPILYLIGLPAEVMMSRYPIQFTLCTGWR